MYSKKFELRWSDLDPNFHVQHSKYYEFGAFVRMAFLLEHGLGIAEMNALKIGPILFREECVFKKEIRFGDSLTVNLQLASARADYSRWTMVHEIWKNEDVLAAIITADGAWLNTASRKLATTTPLIIDIFEAAPRQTNFTFQ